MPSPYYPSILCLSREEGVICFPLARLLLKKKKKKKKRLIARYADLYLLIKTLFWFTNMSSGLAYDPFSHVPSFTHFIFPC